MSEDQKIIMSAPISNYYGRPYVEKNGDKYYIGIEDYNGDDRKEISKTFYNAWVKEFKNKDGKK